MLVMAVLALGLAGCGKKGAPRADVAPGTTLVYPRVYPDPAGQSTEPRDATKPSVPQQAPLPPEME
ncbi:MAG TPA: hypothetical protein VNT30_15745 [Stellaceae bacterium]|nr:hypothetical protein [Stellaceae bacterium]